MLKFDSLHMTQCAMIIVGFMANVGNVFMKRLQTFFLYCSTFSTFFNVIFIMFVGTFITSMVEHMPLPALS